MDKATEPELFTFKLNSGVGGRKPSHYTRFLMYGSSRRCCNIDIISTENSSHPYNAVNGRNIIHTVDVLKS